MTPRLLSRLRRIYRCPSCGGWRIRPIPSDPNPRHHRCIEAGKRVTVTGYGRSEPTLADPDRTVAVEVDEDQRIADVEFLLGVGTHPDLIVRRVGAPSANALAKWLTRRGRRDLAAPIEHARHRGGSS